MPRNPASRFRSPLIGGQWREDRSKVHVNSIIDVNQRKNHSSSPTRLPRSIYREKPMDAQRLAEIDRQNRLLEKRIEAAIYNGKGIDNKNYFYNTNRINHTTVFRERQYAKTQKENILLEKRLWDIKPFIRSDDWALSYRNHQRHAQLRNSAGNQSSPKASRRSIYSETPSSNKQTPRDAKEEKSTKETEEGQSKDRSRRRKKNSDDEKIESYC